MEPGFYKNMTSGDYHSIQNVASYSGLKQFARSPAHYQAWLRTPQEMTDARLLGQALHMCVLEPELFEKTFISIDGHRGSKDVKIAIADAASRGLVPIKPDMMNDVRRMADNVTSKCERMNLFQNGHAESTIIALDPATDCLIKARPDYIDLDRGVIFDLKTYGDASEQVFRSQLYRMRYDLQAATYLRAAGIHFGVGIQDFVNIVVEDSDPYSVNVLRVDDPTIEKASQVLFTLLSDFSHCVKTGEWPTYPDEIKSINVDIY